MLKSIHSYELKDQRSNSIWNISYSWRQQKRFVRIFDKHFVFTQYFAPTGKALHLKWIIWSILLNSETRITIYT